MTGRYDEARTKKIDVELVQPAPSIDQTHLIIEQDMPEYLFKYTSGRWARDLVERGSLKLGTLYSYRAGEHLTIGQLDQHEGAHEIAYIRPDGFVVAGAITSYNSWIYCVSDQLDRGLFEVFDADTVVEIRARPFIKSLARHLAQVCDVATVRKVQYVLPELIADQKLSSAPLASIMKPVNYENQCEWRMRIEPRPEVSGAPRNSMIQGSRTFEGPRLGLSSRNEFMLGPFLSLLPMFVRLPSLTKYCRIIEA